MTITIKNGIDEQSVEPRPWSPAGSMATMLPNVRTNLEWAVARKNVFDTYIYSDSSLSSSTYYYFPPIPSGMFYTVRVSRTSPFSGFYMRHSSTNYSVTLSTTGTQFAYGNSKYIVFYAYVKAQSSWDSTNPVRVQFLPGQNSPETSASLSSYYQRPGLCLPAVADRTLGRMHLMFPRTDQTGVNAAEFNQLRACAIQAADFPVMHAGIGAFSGYYTFSSWLGLNFPFCADPDGPASLQVLTMIFRLGAQGPASLRVYVGGARSGVIAIAERTWYTDSLCEYRVDLSRQLRQVEPMIDVYGRKLYEINVTNFESDKSSTTIYSWGAYSGIPEGVLNA